MKLRTTTLPLLVLGLLSQALVASQPFDTSKKLEIELSGRHSISIDEIAYFSQAADRVFKARGYAGDYKVDYYSGAGQSDEGPLLDIQLIRWANWTPADFECRIYATAIAGGEKYDLGVFRGRVDSLAVTINQLDERFVGSAAGALDQLYDRLIEKGLIKKAE